MNAENINVCFHIGRGGRFHNQGYKTFDGWITKLQECFGEDPCVIDDDEDGNLLPDDQWRLIDGGGKVLLEGREAIESETGIIDRDGDYDTDIVCSISDCTDEELEVIVKAYNDGEYVSKDVIDTVCDMLGYTHVHSVKVEGTTAQICANDGAKLKSITKDEIDFRSRRTLKEWLVDDMYVLSSDVDKIIDAVYDEWYNPYAPAND